MTIYLYVKTHNKTGLKYLGKTSKNPHTYLGSGIDWKAHLKEHGFDHSTKIIKECQDNQELNYWGRHYSDLWNVAESNEWANRIPETGGGANHTEDRKELFRQQQLGRKKSPRTNEHRNNLSKSLKGIPKPRSKEHQEAWSKSSKEKWKNDIERKAISAATGRANKGRKHTPEALEKKRQSMLKFWKLKKAQESLPVQQEQN
jgi:hypothetical protein